jgi:hypothetical protein
VCATHPVLIHLIGVVVSNELENVPLYTEVKYIHKLLFSDIIFTHKPKRNVDIYAHQKKRKKFTVIFIIEFPKLPKLEIIQMPDNNRMD